MFVEKNIVVIFIYGYFIRVLVDIGVSIFCVSFDFIFKFGINFSQLSLFNVRDVVVVGGERYVSLGVIFLFIFFDGFFIFYIFYVF